MKRHLPLITLLAALSVISGYMIHKLSWMARIGINWFYREYSLFKSWGKTSLVEFIVFMLLLLLHGFIQKRAKPQTALLLHLSGIAVALFGLYITYNDFRNDLSHRIAGERFHIGFYLFWFGWIIIALRFLVGKTTQTEQSEQSKS